jgi:AcrR family transcriptional regulator
LGTVSEVSAPRKRTGRRVGPTVSNQVIVDTARSQFSRFGYEGTTMRTIAQEAETDSALIHHFFLTKEGLFQAAIRGAFNPPDLVERSLAGERTGAGERIARIFLNFWEEPEAQQRLVGMLRSVTAVETAAAMVHGFLGDEVLYPLVVAFGHGNPRLRAALLGSRLIGLATTRYVLGVEPLASLPAERAAVLVAGPLQSALTGAL